MANPRIYLVEDDAVIAELLAFNLQGAGYDTSPFRDGHALFKALENKQTADPDLFILDLMLPGMDGFEICARIRRNEQFRLIPILMLTARGSESDKVRGLETGADDYLTKPFGMRELMARVQALLRRYQKTRNLPADLLHPDNGLEHTNSPVNTETAAGPEPVTGRPVWPGQITCRNILLDDVRHRVYKSGLEIDMTNREYELLKFLMIHRGVAYSRDDLLNHVWGYEYSGETRTVDVHIRQLRRKLEDDDANPVLIETVRGRGYRFTDQVG